MNRQDGPMKAPGTMRIVLKPMGAAAILVAMTALTALAFRSSHTGGGGSAPFAATPPQSPVVITQGSSGGGSSALSLAQADTAAAKQIKINAPSPAIHGHAIYRDGLENGWEAKGWTWVKDYDLNDQSHAHSGQSSIRVHYAEFDGLKFHYQNKALDTHPFNRISFYVYGGKTGGQILHVGGTCGEAKTSGKSVQVGPLPPGRWAAVTVPLDKLNLDNKTNMSSFWIQGGLNHPQPDIYVDEVRLLKANEPAPSGQTLANTPI